MSIKNLSEISSLVTKNKASSSIQLTDSEFIGDSTKYQKLVEGLIRGEWKLI